MSSLSFRYERLEEQLNDLTELHQNEMTNLKQELASMEEKVAYQSYERARDIQVSAAFLKPEPSEPLCSVSGINNVAAAAALTCRRRWSRA